MPSGLVQYFYGEDETNTLCPTLVMTGVAVIRTAASHHFGRDCAHLTQVILNGRGRRMRQGWGSPSRYDPNDAGITQTR